MNTAEQGWSNQLSAASCANNFSHSEGCLFVLFMVSFAVKKLLSWIRIPFVYFCFYVSYSRRWVKMSLAVISVKEHVNQITSENLRCTAPGAQLGTLWWPKEVGGRRFKREGINIYIKLTHFIVQQKLTQYCKAIILELKKTSSTTFILVSGLRLELILLLCI